MRSKPVLTPQKLFSWADRYARRQEAADRGTRYPTLRQASRRFKARISEIEEVAEQGVEDGYLGIAVGGGNSIGHFYFKTDGEKLVEAYR